jgi:molecular chaperone IbpA
MNYKVPNQYPQPNDPHEPWTNRPKDKGHPDWKQVPPKPLTIADLFPRMDQWGIGIAETLEQLKLLSDSKPSYPPYDVINYADDTTVIEVAAAGFSKDDILVTVKDGMLAINGAEDNTPGKEAQTHVTSSHKGIARRPFHLKFALAEYYEVKEAKFEDGLLTIELFKNLPEEKKSKVIDIK